MPAEYMFHDVPSQEGFGTRRAIATTLAEMDRFDVATGLVSLSGNPEVVAEALGLHPERFVASWTFDPNEGMAGVRRMVEAHERWGLKAASFFPHANSPQAAIDAPLSYVFYAKCVELNLPVFVSVGIAGPRVPSATQHVEKLDQVMHDFPDLVVVMRHGAEPWTDLAIKLMLKWPNLYYSTSAFSPRYYPADIVAYANTRGSNKIMYGGYFPMGLSLERIFSEMSAVSFKEEVWPKFLWENAATVLRLKGSR
jgi:predicted TIM-barrel fold metal-dependent hydrolase